MVVRNTCVVVLFDSCESTKKVAYKNKNINFQEQQTKLFNKTYIGLANM